MTSVLLSIHASPPPTSFLPLPLLAPSSFFFFHPLFFSPPLPMPCSPFFYFFLPLSFVATEMHPNWGGCSQPLTFLTINVLKHRYKRTPTVECEAANRGAGVGCVFGRDGVWQLFLTKAFVKALDARRIQAQCLCDSQPGMTCRNWKISVLQKHFRVA